MPVAAVAPVVAAVARVVPGPTLVGVVEEMEEMAAKAALVPVVVFDDRQNKSRYI